MEIGLFDESLKQLNKASKTDPTNAQIFKLKALLYEALNDMKTQLFHGINVLSIPKIKTYY